MHSEKLWSLMADALAAVVDPPSGSPKTIEDAAAEVLGRRGVAASPEDEAFLLDSVAGASRFKPVCEGALQGYCDHLKRNKSDRASMYLVAYLVIFRHAQLGAERMRQLFHKATPMPRLAEYLGYLIDAAAVRACSVPLWLQFYDASFIDTTILRSLHAATPDVQRVMDSLVDATKASLAAASSTPGGEAAAEPPRFMRPTPAPVQRPDRLLARPRGSGLPPAEVREMAHTRPPARPPAVKRTGSRAAPPGAPSSEDGPAPSAAAHATTTSKAVKSPTVAIGFTFLERDALRQASECDARAGSSGSGGGSPSSSPPLPAFTAKDPRLVRAALQRPVHVPTTNAALRREAHLHQQRRAAEERALLALQTHMRDSREFDAWRQAELSRDERQREAQLLERHLAALQSEENVRAAREDRQRQRRGVYHKMRRASVRGERQLRDAEAERVAEKRSFVEGLRAKLAKCRREAEERVARDRLRAAGEVKEESAEARRAARAAEEQRRVEQAVVIQEIRLLRERVRRRQAELVEERRALWGSVSEGDGADVDTPLNGMSMAELQRELERARARDKALEEERRQNIAAAKAKESEERAALEQLCREQRERRGAERAHSRSVKESKAAVARAAQLDVEVERMAVLQRKLEERHRQRKANYAATQESERQRRNEANMRGVDDSAMERERWHQLELAVINRMNAVQAAAKR